jgi:hypothetical protein
MNDDIIRKIMEMFGSNIYDEYKREMDADIKTKITELLLMMDAPISDVNIKGVFEYINLIRINVDIDMGKYWSFDHLE